MSQDNPSAGQADSHQGEAMRFIDSNLVSIVVFTFIGIWTLLRFLGSRKETMSTRLLFTFAPHAAFGFAAFMASCSGNSGASATEACTMNDEFSAYSDDLRRMANAKEMCGKLDNSQDFAICLNQPPIATLERMDTCENVRRLDGELDEWLNTNIPPAKEACGKSVGCGHFLIDHNVQ